mmetsp:Transcript_17361/g.37453  ORF Transcript_17361/g.37453 Transcript_17361/m.37453 type:complete len:85 (-) Transcript_17361:872-1126(-)
MSASSTTSVDTSANKSIFLGDNAIGPRFAGVANTKSGGACRLCDDEEEVEKRKGGKSFGAAKPPGSMASLTISSSGTSFDEKWL